MSRYREKETNFKKMYLIQLQHLHKVKDVHTYVYSDKDESTI